MSNCTTERIQTDECIETRDEGYKKCDSWGWFSWICIGFTWVENLVCVAWKYIEKIVCTVIDVVTTVTGLIVSLIDTILGFIGGIIAFIVDAITSIPFVGRILDWLLNAAKTLIWGLISIFDIIGTTLGLMPEKKLRLVVFILSDEQGNPLISDRSVINRAVQYLINVYREELNVRVIPIKALQYRSAFADNEVASDDYIATEHVLNSSEVLDVCCDACEAGSNLSSRGEQFNLKLAGATFWAGARRLTGYGAPVVAFAVRSYTDGKAGCSLGPLTDFVTVKFQDSDIKISPLEFSADKSLGSVTDLAHEVSHSCGLWHIDNTIYLMAKQPNRGGKLTLAQKILARSSRHVTFF